MELHRCRFVKFQPGAIHHIAAFSTGSHGPLVAVARADQRVELWQPVLGGGARANCSDFHGLNRRESNWICRQSLFSPTGPVEALCFACPPTLCTDSDSDSDDDALDDGASAVVGGSNSVGTSKLASSRRSRAVVPRLFTATADGSVNEFCLKSMQLVGPRQDSMGGGGVWCMAVSPCHRFLALGCEDGCIRLFDIDGPPGTMEYIKTFDRQKGRIVSLLWVPPRSSLDSNQDAVDDNDQYLLTGGGDGLIRKWSVSAGRAIQRITVGRGSDSEETLIWDLKYLG
jgi:U3 small nucleolar RNA-associated protein 4